MEHVNTTYQPLSNHPRSILIALFVLMLSILLIIVVFTTSSQNRPVEKLVTSNLEPLSYTNNFVPSEKKDVTWNFDDEWVPNGEPPKCDDTLLDPLIPPVDITQASGVLYPGQERGGDYKPHGGIRFDNNDTNETEVRAIMNGYLLKASKYEEGEGEIQTLIFYVNPCGIMVMHDHLLTLAPKIEEALKDIPIGKNGDSRTTNIKTKVNITKGELIATAVGLQKTKNIFVDFGLYDLRETNGIYYSPEYRSKQPSLNEYGPYALCWIELFTNEQETFLKNLPTGNEGSLSDYCYK